MVRYGSERARRVRLKAESLQCDSTLHVHRPRWIYPPFAGAAVSLFLFAQALWPVLRIYRRFRFDIIDTHFGYPDGVAGCMLARAVGVPFTMTLRGNEPLHAQSRLKRALLARALRSASRVITVSERLRTFAIDMGVAAEKVRTIPNGVNTAVFYPRERGTWRLENGIATNSKLIVSAGALIERKGHHRVVRALRTLIDQGLNVELAIAGGPGPEGIYDEQIRLLVSELALEHAVHFLGALPANSMAEVLSDADVLCLSSTREGWPNVVHEAMACGTPVVATDVGAVPDMISGPHCGYVVPVGDEAALAVALQTALAKIWDREKIARALMRSWHDVARDVLEEMTSIAGKRWRKS